MDKKNFFLKKMLPNSVDENGEFKNLETQLVEYLLNTVKYSHPLIINFSSEKLSFSGIEDKPLLINISTIEKIKNKHKEDLEFLVKLKKISENSIFAFDSKVQETSKIFVTDKTNIKGYPVIFVVREDKMIGMYSVNEVTSIYDKKNLQNLIDSTIKEGGKVYVNPEKIKILEKMPYKLPEDAYPKNKNNEIKAEKENTWLKKIKENKGIER